MPSKSICLRDRCGIGSAASSKPRTEIVIRDEIDAGRIPSPRFKAASPEITSTCELGEVKEGYLADLWLIDGDPTEDISLFQDRDNILMIMRDGQVHKAPVSRRARSEQVAAE